MRYEPRYVASHRPYAVDLSTLRVTDYGAHRIEALWFRRRKGMLAAVIGEIWDHQTPAPATAIDFLHGHADGRYGGRGLARWDGETLWAPNQPYELAQARQKILATALTYFPRVPARWDAWWTFHLDEKGPSRA